YDVCADGENASDPASERPGRKAAAELGIVSPLKDLGIERSTVRKMFDDLGLKTRVHKETCMATRLPAGVPFTGKDIIFIEECENVIRNASGVEQIRMRLRDGYAELFASPDEIMLLIRNEKEISSMLAVKGVPKIRINMNGYEE
ncbi:MAG: hypothetical protein FWH44_06260, partial [Methanomassiliicoccaceae archaeon]|nr:hypothetical protein [Methanomassiliicoccaceae archaeon]